MAKRYVKKKSGIKKIALERTEILRREADLTTDQKLADRYAKLIQKIAQKVKLKLPRITKRRICKHCNTFLKPGINCRIRVNKGKSTYFCETCKRYMRFGFKGTTSK
jgi:ribonuclease P protein subunit RPR2